MNTKYTKYTKHTRQIKSIHTELIMFTLSIITIILSIFNVFAKSINHQKNWFFDSCDKNNGLVKCNQNVKTIIFVNTYFILMFFCILGLQILKSIISIVFLNWSFHDANKNQINQINHIDNHYLFYNHDKKKFFCCSYCTTLLKYYLFTYLIMKPLIGMIMHHLISTIEFVNTKKTTRDLYKFFKFDQYKYVVLPMLFSWNIYNSYFNHKRDHFML